MVLAPTGKDRPIRQADFSDSARKMASLLLMTAPAPHRARLTEPANQVQRWAVSTAIDRLNSDRPSS